MRNKEYKTYEVKTKKTVFFGISVVIFGLLLTISVCNLFSYVFFSSGISLVSGKQRNANNFYAVEVASFDNYDEAYEFAMQIQKKGGAGYITYNKEYKVLTSLYLTYNDAKSVSENIKADYPSACIYEIILPTITLPSELSEQQQKTLTTSFAVAQSALSTMTNIYLSLDTGEIEDETARAMLYTIYDDCSSQIKSINTNFHQQDESKYIKYKMYLNNFTSHLAEVNETDLSGIELSQIIKYQQIKLAYLYISMANLFQ